MFTLLFGSDSCTVGCATRTISHSFLLLFLLSVVLRSSDSYPCRSLPIHPRSRSTYIIHSSSSSILRSLCSHPFHSSSYILAIVLFALNVHRHKLLFRSRINRICISCSGPAEDLDGRQRGVLYTLENFRHDIICMAFLPGTPRLRAFH